MGSCYLKVPKKSENKSYCFSYDKQFFSLIIQRAKSRAINHVLISRLSEWVASVAEGVKPPLAPMPAFIITRIERIIIISLFVLIYECQKVV